MSEVLAKVTSQLDERMKETVAPVAPPTSSVAQPISSMTSDDVVLKVFLPGKGSANVCVPRR